MPTSSSPHSLLRHVNWVIAGLGLLLLLSGSALAQELEEIQLDNGVVYRGQLEDENALSIWIRDRNGILIRLPKDQVRQRRILATEEPAGPEDFLSEDRHTTRLLVGPNARPVPAGSGYVNLHAGVVPTVTVGIGYGTSVSAGFSMVPGIARDEQQLFIGGKKNVYRHRSIDVAASAIYTVSGARDQNLLAGYLLWTVGRNDLSVTFGIGMVGNFSSSTAEPAVVLGGEFRLSEHLKLISENLIPPASDLAIFSGALRVFGDRWLVDLGLLIPYGSGLDRLGVAAPWVSAGYRFGR